LLSTQTTIN